MAMQLLNWQVDGVAHTLSEAFFNDPMFTYILPDEEGRRKRLQWFFRSGIQYGLSYGYVYTNDTLDGGAIWLTPGHTTVTFQGMLRSGLAAAPLQLGWQAFGRFLTLTNATEAVHKRLISSPHYYLLTLGVRTEKQRKGIGADLLQPILTQASRNNVPCYLETEQESNIAFYERHGFCVRHEGKIPRGPRFWAMVREPEFM